MRLLTVLFLGLVLQANAQTTFYFPPATGTWETLSTDSLGWCAERIDSLEAFLNNSNSKSFILLKDGKMVMERYYNGHSENSPWYWASAGKTLSSTIIGIAASQNLLDIDDPVSNYLGDGWTSVGVDTESLITIRHLLSMTSGLDDTPDVSDTIDEANLCSDPSCLQYLAMPGTRWAYHTGAYYKLAAVAEAVYGQSYQQITNQQVMNKIGGGGYWFENEVYWSNTRSMAKFGLMMLNGGDWNVPVLQNSAFYEAATQTSQNLNEAYGFLWWVNGQNSFMLPTLQFAFDGTLMSNAPSDMFMALGKNDQKIHVIPSKGWVIVRMGNSYSDSSPVPLVFDDDLWGYLNNMTCTPSTVETPVSTDWKVVNSGGAVEIQWPVGTPWRLSVFTIDGKRIQTLEGNAVSTNLILSAESEGLYLLVGEQSGNIHRKLIRK